MGNRKNYFNHNHPTSNRVLTFIALMLHLKGSQDEVIEFIHTHEGAEYSGVMFSLHTDFGVDISDKEQVQVFVERAIEYIADNQIFLKLAPHGHF
jgi:hypothetical protein